VREEIKRVRKIFIFSDFHYQRLEACVKYVKMQLQISELLTIMLSLVVIFVRLTVTLLSRQLGLPVRCDWRRRRRSCKERVLRRAVEDRSILSTIKRRKVNWIGTSCVGTALSNTLLKER